MSIRKIDITEVQNGYVKAFLDRAENPKPATILRIDMGSAGGYMLRYLHETEGKEQSIIVYFRDDEGRVALDAPLRDIFTLSEKAQEELILRYPFVQFVRGKESTDQPVRILAFSILKTPKDNDEQEALVAEEVSILFDSFVEAVSCVLAS